MSFITTTNILQWAFRQPPLLVPKFEEKTFDFYYNCMDKEKTTDFLLNHYHDIETVLQEQNAEQILPMLCLNSCLFEYNPAIWKLICDDLKTIVLTTVIETFYSGGYVESNIELDETNHWKMSIEEGRKAMKEDLENQIHTFVFRKTAQTCTPFGFI